MTEAAPIRVMLLEDHEFVRSALRHALEAGAIEVVDECSTGEEALLRAPGVRPDVLIVDLDLPGQNGLFVVRELAPRLPATRILVLTVSALEADMLDAMRNGAHGYLTKNLSPDALVRAVRGLVAGQLAMSRSMATRLAERYRELARSRYAPTPGGVVGLSPRENEVLRLLAEGLTDREIADALTISRRTVESHVGNILDKLGVHNRAQAARRYRVGEAGPG